jgi:predicted nucleotidyltransferase
MTETRKSFVLLGAYEALTEKETFCLKEANFEVVSKIQSKKDRLLKELQNLEDRESLESDEKDEFNRRLQILQECEKSNEALLKRLKAENRSQFKSLSKRASSASQIRRAYGSAANPDGLKRNLKDKA